jgi:hypothetical protein
MKTKITLAREQLETVAQFRGRGWSWAAIGRELDINRQVVKREYSNWEESQAQASLQAVHEEPIQAVRQEALVEEFHKHLDSLSTLAQELSEPLDKALTSRQSTPADDVFAAVLEVDRPLSNAAEEPYAGKLRQVWRRRRRWLYQSLLTHLSVTNWADNLQEWKECLPARDNAQRELEAQALKCLRVRLESHFKDLDWDDDAFLNLAGELAAVTWAVTVESQEINAEQEDPEGGWEEIFLSVWQPDKYIQLAQREAGWTLRVLGKDVSPPFPSEEQAQGMKMDCEAVVVDLLRGGDAMVSAQVSRQLARCTEELLKLLDPLQLRPLLLRTKCYLCSA